MSGQLPAKVWILCVLSWAAIVASFPADGWQGFVLGLAGIALGWAAVLIVLRTNRAARR